MLFPLLHVAAACALTVQGQIGGPGSSPEQLQVAKRAALLAGKHMVSRVGAEVLETKYARDASTAPKLSLHSSTWTSL